jgi:hypothetical protein
MVKCVHGGSFINLMDKSHTFIHNLPSELTSSTESGRTHEDTSLDNLSVTTKPKSAESSIDVTISESQDSEPCQHANSDMIMDGLDTLSQVALADQLGHQVNFSFDNYHLPPPAGGRLPSESVEDCLNTPNFLNTPVTSTSDMTFFGVDSPVPIAATGRCFEM